MAKSIRSLASIVVVLLVALLLLGGSRADRAVHAEGDGPLSAFGHAGGFTIFMPPEPTYPWYGSFGAHVPCVTEPGVRVELQRLSWDSGSARTRPLDVEPVLRFVDGSVRPRGTVGIMLGRPWKPHQQREVPGEFRRGVAGTVITQSCAETRTAGDPYSWVDFTELIFVIKTGRSGAHVPRVYLDYLADGVEHRLIFDEEMVLCGRNTRECPVTQRRAGR